MGPDLSAPIVEESRPPKVLSLDTMNRQMLNVKFAMRGAIEIRSAQIAEDLKRGKKVLPFKSIIWANIGDAQGCGAKPLTFFRQLQAVCQLPALMDSDEFPYDVKERARRILASCKGCSIGAYSAPAGIEVVRRDAADAVTARDGGVVPECDFHDIILSNGASETIKAVLELLMPALPGSQAGIMIAVPQYPVYSAVLTELGGHSIYYYLNEEDNWSLDIKEMEKAVTAAREYCVPRAIVVINPGNPTGQVLSRTNIEEIIRFAHREKLVILADEVYLFNVYSEDSQFHSFKKVMYEMGEEYKYMELATFFSASKGYLGECGCRGGGCELWNVDTEVKGHLIKTLSTRICPNVLGQLAVEVVANPPKLWEPSYELFEKEKRAILGDLAAKAQLLNEKLNLIPGIKCTRILGSMFCLPQIFLPAKAIEAAKLANMEPDYMYCYQFLEEEGVSVIPGSMFGQKQGTHHFRISFMPRMAEIEDLLVRLERFHARFIHIYSISIMD